MFELFVEAEDARVSLGDASLTVGLEVSLYTIVSCVVEGRYEFRTLGSSR